MNDILLQVANLFLILMALGIGGFSIWWGATKYLPRVKEIDPEEIFGNVDTPPRNIFEFIRWQYEQVEEKAQDLAAYRPSVTKSILYGICIPSVLFIIILWPELSLFNGKPLVMLECIPAQGTDCATAVKAVRGLDIILFVGDQLLKGAFFDLFEVFDISVPKLMKNFGVNVVPVSNNPSDLRLSAVTFGFRLGTGGFVIALAYLYFKTAMAFAKFAEKIGLRGT